MTNGNIISQNICCTRYKILWWGKYTLKIEIQNTKYNGEEIHTENIKYYGEDIHTKNQIQNTIKVIPQEMCPASPCSTFFKRQADSWKRWYW